MNWLLIVALALVVVLFIAYFFAKGLIKWIINSLIGIFALMGWNALFPAQLVINFWSVLLVAVLGVVGLIIVVLFHFFGVAF